MDTTDLNELILQIHETVFAPELWPQVIQSVAHAIDASSGVLVTPTVEANSGFLTGAYNIDAVLFERYPNVAPYDLWIPVADSGDGVTRVASLFGLTQAEERLLAMLARTEDLSEAAMRLHVSLHTARTQLKSIFNRTGRRTQTTLLTFVARLSALRVPIR